ncbi:MAG TPA: UvrD-helicase domain-containing protein [Syntrophorhabdaceae bacterium]|nr:UvrD-helicase domain-containing protein [Syntrophorhabdaceae bacterium]
MKEDGPASGLPQIITVRSSAGAGKTYRLAQHYIVLLLLDILSGKPTKSRIANLVAITFTNKAAQEMRGRIIDWMKRIILDIPFENLSLKALDEIVENEWIKIASPPSSEPGHNGAAFLRNALKGAIEKDFNDLLKNYYSFNVSTIDSFVNLILKASAFKLNLPPVFDVSLESSSMIDLVLKECLQKISEDRAVRLKFDRFIDNYIETEGDNVSWSPKEVLKEIIADFWDQESRENKSFVIDPDSLAKTARLRERIQAQARILKDTVTGNPKLIPRTDFLKALDSCILIKGNQPGRGATFDRDELDACFKKGSAAVKSDEQDLWRDIMSLRIPFVEAAAQSKFIPYVEIYKLFKDMLRTEITYRKRLVLIEQLNRLLQDVIHERGFVPEIYYTLAERYTHFLIDEFQDTNHLQWQNIEVLTEEAIARGGTLFLVGDKKQAIYRWRGGEAELVDEVAAHYRAYKVDEQVLRTNYRSAGHIVFLNNVVFACDNLRGLVNAVLGEHEEQTSERILKAYRDSEQYPLKDKENEGYVRIEKVALKDDEETIRTTFTMKERGDVVAQKLKALIERIRARGVFQDREIAILVRRKDEARLIVKTLLEMGLNVESELTVNVKNNLLVKELLAFLSFISTPDDDLSFASFTTGNIFQKRTGIAHAEIVEWLTNKRTDQLSWPLYSIFRQDYPKIWDQYFEEFFSRSGYLPLYEFTVLFIKRWSVFEHFPHDIPYFLHICEFIKNREDSGENNLNALLRTLADDPKNLFMSVSDAEKAFLLKASDAVDAIKVMTIHKAKGLQFPVVILPLVKLNSFGASEERDKTKYFAAEGGALKSFYIKKDFRDVSPKLNAMYQKREADYLLDELNNIYVATTRAEKELYIFLTDSKGQKRNYLIDHFFGLTALRSYTRSETIEIGAEYQAAAKLALADHDHRHLSSGGATADVTDQFKDGSFSGEIRWLEKIRTKFEETENITRQQLHAKQRGDVIHYILSLIISLPQNPEAVLNRCIDAGIAKYCFHPFRQDVEQVILNLFRDTGFKRFFETSGDTRVFTEKEVIDEKGNAFKIDRIIVSGDCVDIVDFKSGEGRSQEHHEQMNRYAELMKKIYPAHTVRAHLLYIEENKIINI